MKNNVTCKTYRTIAMLSVASPVIMAMIGFMLYGTIGVIFHLPGFDDTYSRWVEILMAIVCIALIIFLSWLWIDAIIRHKIMLDENEIFAPQNTCFKKQSYQLEVHIPYDEIVSVTLTTTTRTSENEVVWYLGFPKEWAIFDMKDGTVKRLCIGLYTKKTAIRILDDIIANCAAVGNELDVKSGADLIEQKIEKKRKKKEEQ